MSNCPNCGSPISEGAKFCTSCGTPVSVAAPEQQATAQAQQPYDQPLGQQPYQQSAAQPYGNAADQQPYQQPYGNAADQQPYQQPANQPYGNAADQQPYQQPYAQAQPVYADPAQQAVSDSGSIGWGILGFFFPIVGLILFLVWKNTKPKCAKVAGIGAIVGVCINLFYMIGSGAFAAMM